MSHTIRTYHQLTFNVAFERSRLRQLRDEIARDMAGKQRKREALARAQEMELRAEQRGELRSRR